MLKSGSEIRLDDIGPLLGDGGVADDAIDFFAQYKTMGWPYRGGWAEQPARLPQSVMLLDMLDRLYHPRMMM